MFVHLSGVRKFSKHNQPIKPHALVWSRARKFLCGIQLCSIWSKTPVPEKKHARDHDRYSGNLCRFLVQVLVCVTPIILLEIDIANTLGSNPLTHWTRWAQFTTTEL